MRERCRRDVQRAQGGQSSAQALAFTMRAGAARAEEHCKAGVRPKTNWLLDWMRAGFDGWAARCDVECAVGVVEKFDEGTRGAKGSRDAPQFHAWTLTQAQRSEREHSHSRRDGDCK